MKKPEHEPESNGPLYWGVESRSEPGASHLVYLGGNGGVGTCFCTWARSEVTPAIREGRKPKKLCYHIEQAHKRFHRWAIYQFTLANKNHGQDGTPNNAP